MEHHAAEEKLSAISDEELEEEIEEEEEEEEEVEEEVEEEEPEEEEEMDRDNKDDEKEEQIDTKNNNSKLIDSAAAAVASSGGEEAKIDGDASGVTPNSAAGKIFVGGVAWETTEESFAKHFEKYGEITDSVIMKEKHTQKPRGFGFVTFADPSVIDKVLEDEHVIDGRTVEVKRTVPREDMSSKGAPKTKKIFVGGIPPTFTEDQLKEHFTSYGTVVEHQIMLDHNTGRPRGFGFVTFESEEAVEKVISEGKMHDLGGKQVEIKKAEPKKAGSDVGTNGRATYVAGGGNMYPFEGGAYGYGSGGGGGSGYRSGGMYYGGRGAGGYGRGYGYGGSPGYGAGFGPAYGAPPPMYGAGGYGAGNVYGAPGGYAGGYGGYGGGGGRGSRYHPYGR